MSVNARKDLISVLIHAILVVLSAGRVQHPMYVWCVHLLTILSSRAPLLAVSLVLLLASSVQGPQPRASIANLLYLLYPLCLYALRNVLLLRSKC